MWTAETTELSAAQIHFSVVSGGVSLTYAEVLSLWANSEEFRRFWIETLTEPDWIAYRWETPPLTTQTVDRDFECVLLRSDGLDRTLDRDSFQTHFAAATESITVFENLGRNATLVVPCPIGELDCYGHIARFLRDAPVAQKHELWQVVATTMNNRIGEEPIWLSTAGAGVSWLHVRLDKRPKYYGYQPFTEVTAEERPTPARALPLCSSASSWVFLRTATEQLLKPQIQRTTTQVD